MALRDHGFTEATRRLRQLLPARPTSRCPSNDTADLVVTCSAAPLPRSLVDPLLADGTAHLVVAGTGHPGSLRVGPLVSPASPPACAASTPPSPQPTLADPCCSSSWPCSRPDRISPLVLALGLAWAARDVVAHASGSSASTWSATLDAHDPAPEVVRWPRHPDCGCCWDELPY